MPNIVGTSLKTSEPIELVDVLRGKISLLAISGTRFGEEQIETYMRPFLTRWPAGSSKVQMVEVINSGQSWIKIFFKAGPASHRSSLLYPS